MSPAASAAFAGTASARLASSRSVRPAWTSPCESTSTTDRSIASGATPASAIASRSRRAIPIPAAPAPARTIRSSAQVRPKWRMTASAAASTTTAVPWMSSLNEGTRSRYRSRMRSAFGPLKSSHWMRQPGQVASTPRTKASTRASYSGPPDPRRRVADIERVVAQRAVVGPHVERHGQGHRGMDARGRRVQRELADRDGHAARALVAQPEDALVVRDDDEPDVAERRRLQDGRDPLDIGRGDPDAARPPHDVAELLARPPDRRRVDDRQELLEVLGQHPVEERGVAVLEGGQADVLLEVVGLAPDVLDLEGDLLLDREDPVGQEAAQAELDPLLLAEREVLGEEPSPEEVGAGLLDLDRFPPDHPVERVRKRAHRAKDRAPATRGRRTAR